MIIGRMMEIMRRKKKWYLYEKGMELRKVEMVGKVCEGHHLNHMIELI